MCTALSIQPKLIYDELHSIFGDQATPYSKVTRWSKWFREGREEIEGQPRIGRSVTETISDHIEEVRCLIHDLIIDQIEEETRMSHGTNERIICDHLKLRKMTVRWVPNLLTDNQRAERVRLCQENLAKFQQGTCRFCDVMTGDESWFYHK
jgi:hypothetical protein